MGVSHLDCATDTGAVISHKNSWTLGFLRFPHYSACTATYPIACICFVFSLWANRKFWAWLSSLSSSCCPPFPLAAVQQQPGACFSSYIINVCTWDVMAPWLSRLLSTGGSWVRLPL